MKQKKCRYIIDKHIRYKRLGRAIFGDKYSVKDILWKVFGWYYGVDRKWRKDNIWKDYVL